MSGLAPARGRLPGPPIPFEIVRELTEGDLEALRAQPLGSKPPLLQQLRSSHHQLARLIAQGLPGPEIQLITGYSSSRISILRADPSFAELISHYEGDRELAFIDVLERMKHLGLSTLEEIQQRLEERPEQFSQRELLEVAELMLVKGRAAPGSRVPGDGGRGASGGVSVNVQFIQAPSGPVVQGEVIDG